MVNHAVNGSVGVERCVGHEVSRWIVHASARTLPLRCIRCGYMYVQVKLFDDVQKSVAGLRCRYRLGGRRTAWNMLHLRSGQIVDSSITSKFFHVPRNAYRVPIRALSVAGLA